MEAEEAEYEEDDAADIDFDAIEPDQRERNSQKRKKKKEKGCCKYQPPAVCVQISDFLRKVIEHPYFERTVIVLILLNTAFLASEHY